MQNLMLNWLAPISNTKKWKTKKLACPFLITLFHFEANLIDKKVFPLFLTILDSWEISSKSFWSRKNYRKNCNLVPRVPSFYIWTKSRLKSCVTTVHLLQCKTNFFIYLSFWGRNLLKLRNIHVGKLPLISKKFFFDLFTLVYIHLDSCTIV